MKSLIIAAIITASAWCASYAVEVEQVRDNLFYDRIHDVYIATRNYLGIFYGFRRAVLVYSEYAMYSNSLTFDGDTTAYQVERVYRR